MMLGGADSSTVRSRMCMEQKELTRCLKALANERRMRIIQELLAVAPLDVGALARRIHLSYKSTAKHIAQLERCDLLQRTRRGIEVFYRVDRSHPLLRSILQYVRK